MSARRLGGMSMTDLDSAIGSSMNLTNCLSESSVVLSSSHRSRKVSGGVY